MAKKNDQEFVKHITPRSENFSQWYTDVVLQADLMDYTPVRGCMAIKPYGYGIWELIQKELDAVSYTHLGRADARPAGRWGGRSGRPLRGRDV